MSNDQSSRAPSEEDRPQTDTPQPPPSESADPNDTGKTSNEGTGRAPAVVARYGRMGQIGAFRYGRGALPAVGSKVVARTERGVELATVIARVCDGDGPFDVSPGRLDDYLKQCGSGYPFRRHGKLLRVANQQDLIDDRHLQGSAREEAAFCRRQIDELNLKMKLVSVEHLLGGERIIFYFTAESRVDFRELVRRLASQYHTRIEMRQLGARDEARLAGDYERCGRECCCRAFLKYLRPVSMRMAKTQKATLDPSKISGRCGRLMCCLRYEDAGYKDLKSRLPHRKTYVRAGDVYGRVVETQILTQLVKLVRPDGTFVVVANEDITERDAALPGAGDKDSDKKSGGPTQASAAVKARQNRNAAAPAADKDAGDTGDGRPSAGDSGGGKKKKRRGRRGRRRRGKSKGSGGGHGSGGQGGSKTKRRRKKKKPGGGSS
ncbi:MAG: hypothetical protein KGY99_10685 [Phycisphaerae bacterium]|nr:hypothetical protein [Phycisphaerae bacterium]